jgi:hypothetical protein
MSKHIQTGRDATEKELREAERVLSLTPVQQRNHPSAVPADHSKLSHINTYGSLPEFYLDQPFTCRKWVRERFGRPETRSGITRRRRDILMRERLSAMIVAQRRSEPKLRMKKPPNQITAHNAGWRAPFRSAGRDGSRHRSGVAEFQP